MKHHTFEKRFDRHIRAFVSTIIRSCVWLLLPAWLVIVLYDIKGVTQDAIGTYFILLVLLFGFVFPVAKFVHLWVFRRKHIGSWGRHIYWRCCSFIPLTLFYETAREDLIRSQKIGQLWFNQDPYKYMAKEIERIKRNADLKVRLLKENRNRDTAKERKRLQKLLTWAQKRKNSFMMERFVFVARAISQHVREIEDHCHFHEDNLTDLFHRYQHAFDFHKDIIARGYNQRMSPGYEPKLPDISPKQNTIEG